MPELGAAFRELGLEDVRTVLATGNVVFTSGRSSVGELRARLEQALSETFDYEAFVHLVEVAKLERLVADYPFERKEADLQPYVMFTSDARARRELLALAPSLDPSVERIAPGSGVIYWEVRRGHSTESPFAKASSKASFRPVVTTRNLRTLEKVIAVAR